MIFASKNRLNNVSNVNVICKNVEIGSKSEVKYRGAILKQDILMGINAIQKINRNLMLLHRNGDFFHLECRKIICSSLIQCRFDYGCNMWYRSIVNSLKVKLQTAPKTGSLDSFSNKLNLKKYIYISLLHVVHNICFGTSAVYM